MQFGKNTSTNLFRAVSMLASMIVTAGCDVRIASFESNAIFAKRMELLQDVPLKAAVTDSQWALNELFGTPDAPKWPEILQQDEAFANLVSIDRLQRAAGPVRSDEQDVHFGLFREHCVHCHGVTGNGLGPTSRFLNPYPRDFLAGKLKFKTTPIGTKPTRVDLHRILREGVMGTSMPSFRLLRDEELEALVDYVIYLSIRGEVERRMLTDAALELDIEGGERLVDISLRQNDPETFQRQWGFIEDHVVSAAESWLRASETVLETDGPDDDYALFGRDSSGSIAQQQRLAESIARGRQLFQGPVANCATCHGATATGDGQPNSFDDWTKEWTIHVGLDPLSRADVAPMLALGALKPRFILPRNLRMGIYRGGSQPIDLYHRIVNGIEGTPMPAAPMKPTNSQGLTQEEVWDLVNYLLSLPYEPIDHAG